MDSFTAPRHHDASGSSIAPLARPVRVVDGHSRGWFSPGRPEQSQSNIDEERREQIAASRDALGILFSLLLGFTLAMALPRCDLREQLVMEEANAIGTTTLRAGVLPEAKRSQVRALLRAYVQARQVYSEAIPGESQLTAAIERTKALQSSLWHQAEESVRQSGSSWD